MTGGSDALSENNSGPELRRYFYALESEGRLAFGDGEFLKPGLISDLLTPEDPSARGDE